MTHENLNTQFMKRCLELAGLGQQNVAPNPMVGAVLVHNGRIIGEGFHQKCGEAHAEVNAINSVSSDDQHLINKSTLYVSLEPCSHHGKTPPCSDLIVMSNIPKVVIGCIDTYSEVAGKGIEKLRKHNIEVEVGILEKEARALNKRFFTFHEQKRPYIILKWAQSTDGYIDKVRMQDTPEINWITQPETQQLTHQWRAEEAGILVGHRTIHNDDPSLTVRAVDGKNPTRIVLTSDKDTFPSNSKIFDESAKTIFIDPNVNTLDQILNILYENEIQSVIIEGGRKTLQQFIDAGIWDEARILTGNSLFTDGIKAPVIDGRLDNQFTFGADLIQVYKND